MPEEQFQRPLREHKLVAAPATAKRLREQYDLDVTDSSASLENQIYAIDQEELDRYVADAMVSVQPAPLMPWNL